MAKHGLASAIRRMNTRDDEKPPPCDGKTLRTGKQEKFSQINFLLPWSHYGEIKKWPLTLTEWRVALFTWAIRELSRNRRYNRESNGCMREKIASWVRGNIFAYEVLCFRKESVVKIAEFTAWSLLNSSQMWITTKRSFALRVCE